MVKCLSIVVLIASISPALAQDGEQIVQWKKDPMHLFVGPNHELTLRQKSELPPEAVITNRQDPLLGFKDSKTNQTVYVNKSEVVTNKSARADVPASEPRRGSCTRALGTGFARSC